MKGKGARIRLDIPWRRERKSALRDALLAALREEGWSIRVRSTLVYAEPLVGTWWWKVAVTEPGGATQTLLVEPGHQTLEFVVDLVRRGVARELLSVLCASCGKIAVGGVWQRREETKKNARLNHGLCPECALKLYPDAIRRMRAHGGGKR